MAVFRATLGANAENLAAFGLALDSVDGWFSSAPVTLGRVAIPGRMGSVVTRAERGEKLVTASGTIAGDTVAGRNTAIDRVLATLAAGTPINLTRADVGLRTAAAGYVSGPVTVQPVRPGMRSPYARVQFQVAIPSGVIREQTPQPYALPVGIKTALPLGTAPVAPVLRIVGAFTNPQVIYRHVNGDILATVTFTTTRTSSDWLEVDCDSYRVDTFIAGTRNSTYNVYAGQAAALPVLDPSDGDWINGAFPSLELVGASGIALYARLYW